MSTAEVMLWIVVGVALAVLGMVVLNHVAPKVRKRWAANPSEPEPEPELKPEPEPVDDPTDPWEYQTEASPQTRVIDPDNPPTWRVYWPQSGAQAPTCSCHGIALQPGDKVVLWPIPNHPEGAIDIFCERTFQEAQ